MKQGDILITENGIELIAVRSDDNETSCIGCFFYRKDGCYFVNKGLGVDCWEDNGDELIFKFSKNEKTI